MSRRILWAAAAAIVCGAAEVSGAAPAAAPANFGEVAGAPSWTSLALTADAQTASDEFSAAVGGGGTLGGPTFLALTHRSAPVLVFMQQGRRQDSFSPAAAGRMRLQPDGSSGVPEPESYALLTAGLGAIALLMRRRRLG